MIVSKYPTKTEAMNTLFSKWIPIYETEIVFIEEALNRICAEDVYSNNTLPLVRASSADGIATSSEYFKNGLPDTSAWTEGTEYERADTGDDFDDKYDFIVRIEDVMFDESGKISLSKDIKYEPGTNVSKKGKIVSKNDKLISKDTKIRPHHLASLAMGGHEYIRVRKKPKVAFIPTGSELVCRGSIPKRGQNVDSNSIMIKNMLMEMGAEPLCFPIVKDITEDLEFVLDEALYAADIVVINAGSSKGKEDLNTELIKKRGELLHHRIAAAPGFPLGMGIIDNKPVINLPGPNIAAFYGADWCVRGAVARALNIPSETKETVKAILQESMSTPAKMDFLCKMELKKDEDGNYLAYPKLHRAHPGAVSSSADAFYISPIGTSKIEKGETIEVELLNSRAFIEGI